MVTWVVFLTIGLVIGIAAGFFFGQLDGFKRRQREELQSKLESTQKTLAEYKQEVTAHFVKTSSLVNNLTESYKAVHEHLAGGAKVLCDSQLEVNKLNINDVKLIDEKSEPTSVTAFTSANATEDVKSATLTDTDKLTPDKSGEKTIDKTSHSSAEDAKKPQDVKLSEIEKLTPEIPSDTDSIANKDVASASIIATSAVDRDRSGVNPQSDNEQVKVPHTRTVH